MNAVTWLLVLVWLLSMQVPDVWQRLSEAKRKRGA